MIFVFLIMAILIGSLMPFQAGLNAELTRSLKHPYLGAFVSLTTGAIAVLLIIFIKGAGPNELKRIAETPPHLFLGGILGAVFVGSSLFLIPKLGATAMIGGFVTGQLIASILIDHYGILGLNPNPINLSRIVGVILLFAGLFLVIKKSA